MATATRADTTQAVHKEIGLRPREAAKITSGRVVLFRASAKPKKQINDARAVCGQDAQASPRSSLNARPKALRQRDRAARDATFTDAHAVLITLANGITREYLRYLAE